MRKDVNMGSNKNVVLSRENKITANKNFPSYLEMSEEHPAFVRSMFKSLFAVFHKQKKLGLILEECKYYPFSHTILTNQWDLFQTLMNVLPQDRYRFLVMSYDNYSILHMLVDKALDNLEQEKPPHTRINAALQFVSSLNPQVKEELHHYLSSLNHPQQAALKNLLNTEALNYINSSNEPQSSQVNTYPSL